jgi:hypothetical protein
VALDGYRCGEGSGTSRKTIAKAPRGAAKREQPAAALAIRSTEMGLDKKEMIEQLKFEIEMIEKGGYYPSVREPRQNPEIFRDSITCLNVGLEEKEHPCSSCFLSEFAPPEVRNSTGDICHKIPLNEKGDTVESLKAEDNPKKLQTTVLGWLKRTVTELEEEVAVKN